MMRTEIIVTYSLMSLSVPDIYYDYPHGDGNHWLQPDGYFKKERTTLCSFY